jgi:hypothetical protein
MQIIIIILILFFIFSQISENFDILEDDTSQQFCHLYGCSNIRAYDDNQLNVKDTTKIEPEKIEPVKIEQNKTVNKITELKDYKYIGILTNTYYNQKYMLYGKPFTSDYELQDKLFEYKLFSTNDTVLKEEYVLPPRTEILEGEHVWIAYGSLQLGPLFLKK